MYGIGMCERNLVVVLLGVKPWYRHTWVPCRTVMCLGRLHATKITTTTNFATPRSPQMEPIDAALAAINASGPREKLVYAQIAKRYGVKPTTLTRRHQGLTTSRAAYHKNQHALCLHQELELTQYINRISKQGLSPTKDTIRKFASQIA